MVEGQIGVFLQPVGDADYNALLEVYRQCEDFLALGPEPCASPEMVQADLRHSANVGGTFYGIVDDRGVLLGVVDFVPAGFGGCPEHAFLELLMIARPYRSAGLGAHVVRLVEAAIQQQAPQVTAVLSAVQVNNPVAIRFWQRQGYQIVGEPEAQPDGTTVYPLRKELHGIVIP